MLLVTRAIGRVRNNNPPSTGCELCLCITLLHRCHFTHSRNRLLPVSLIARVSQLAHNEPRRGELALNHSGKRSVSLACVPASAVPSTCPAAQLSWMCGPSIRIVVRRRSVTLRFGAAISRRRLVCIHTQSPIPETYLTRWTELRAAATRCDAMSNVILKFTNFVAKCVVAA